MLLTEAELKDAAREIEKIILSSRQTAVVQRALAGEKLYATDDGQFIEVGQIAVELLPTSPEDLSGKIDATVAMLPSEDIRTEDRLVIADTVYRVQTVVAEHLFGTVTYQTAKLVKLSIS